MYNQCYTFIISNWDSIRHILNRIQCRKAKIINATNCRIIYCRGKQTGFLPSFQNSSKALHFVSNAKYYLVYRYFFSCLKDPFREDIFSHLLSTSHVFPCNIGKSLVNSKSLPTGLFKHGPAEAVLPWHLHSSHGCKC